MLTKDRNSEILNSFNVELQLTDTEFAITINLMVLLSELKNFKFMKTIIFDLKILENDDKTKYSTFY